MPAAPEKRDKIIEQEAESEEQSIQPPPLTRGEGDVLSLPETENKTSANELVQSEAQGDVVEKNNSSTTSYPERKNNVLSLPSEDL